MSADMNSPEVRDATLGVPILDIKAPTGGREGVLCRHRLNGRLGQPAPSDLVSVLALLVRCQIMQS
jgi:hypothetical protein